MPVELSMKDAAQRLGVSRDTVRRRIRAYRQGEPLEPPILAARLDEGGRWMLTLDVPEAAAPDEGAAQLVDVLQDEVADLRERLDDAQERLRAADAAQHELRALLLNRDTELDRLHAQIQRLLPAPAASPAAGVQEPAISSVSNVSEGVQQPTQPPAPAATSRPPRPAGRRSAGLPLEGEVRALWGRLRGAF